MPDLALGNGYGEESFIPRTMLLDLWDEMGVAFYDHPPLEQIVRRCGLDPRIYIAVADFNRAGYLIVKRDA